MQPQPAPRPPTPQLSFTRITAPLIADALTLYVVYDARTGEKIAALPQRL